MPVDRKLLRNVFAMLMPAWLAWQIVPAQAQTVQSVTQYSYDSMENVECVAERMNPATFSSPPASACTLGASGSQGSDRITRNIYDVAGQLLQVRRAVGTSLEEAYVTYSYTTHGKQEFVVDANGNRARLIYDEYDRQVQWQFPTASLPGSYDDSTQETALATAGTVNTADYEQYGYDANGNRTSLRKRDGRTLIYEFDALNRMTAKTVPDCPVSGPCCQSYICSTLSASQTRDIYYSYDLRGLRKAARFDSANGADAVTTSYDGFGRLSRSTTSMGGVSRTIGYQYDPDGNRTRITYPDGNYAAYTFDGLNRLYTAGINRTVGVVQHTYDAVGNLTQRATPGSWTFYAYDGANRLAGQNEALAGGSGNVNRTFIYNASSQLASLTRDNSAYSFSSYQNTARNYTANGLNQYVKVGPNNYDNDSNGNLTWDGGTTYAYDAENRLVLTSTGAQLVYDPLGRLYETYKTSTGTTRFLYDGDQLVAEYDAAGTMLKRYVHGPGEDDPLAWLDGAAVGGSWSNGHLAKPDQRGSLVLWTDWNGALSQINRYDEYGVPAATNAGRFQYTGQAWVPELGMYYYKARIYSPALGRFMQSDPIGYQDQINLYAYAGNDPINKTDPTGLRQCPPCVDWSDVKQVVKKAPATASRLGTWIFTGARIASPVAVVVAGMWPSPTNQSEAQSISKMKAEMERAAFNPERGKSLTVYRLWGGNSGPYGRSWTTQDPRLMANPRDYLGLPVLNSATNLSIGTLHDWTGVTVQKATRLDNTAGGGPELVVPAPQVQIRVNSVMPFKEPK